jgi:hypothetical protein
VKLREIIDNINYITDEVTPDIPAVGLINSVIDQVNERTNQVFTYVSASSIDAVPDILEKYHWVLIFGAGQLVMLREDVYDKSSILGQKYEEVLRQMESYYLKDRDTTISPWEQFDQTKPFTWWDD